MLQKQVKMDIHRHGRSTSFFQPFRKSSLKNIQTIRLGNCTSAVHLYTKCSSTSYSNEKQQQRTPDLMGRPCDETFMHSLKMVFSSLVNKDSGNNKWS